MRDAKARQLAGHQVVCAAVQAALREQVVARRQHGEQRGGDRRHAARTHQRGLGLLERGDLGVQREMAGRVVGAQVAHVVVALLAGVLEGGRLEDRHLHRAGDARQRLAGVHQLCLDVSVGRHGCLADAPVMWIRYRVRMPASRDSTARRAGTVPPHRRYGCGCRGGA
jgi:hypothetical protein